MCAYEHDFLARRELAKHPYIAGVSVAHIILVFAIAFLCVNRLFPQLAYLFYITIALFIAWIVLVLISDIFDLRFRLFKPQKSNY